MQATLPQSLIQTTPNLRGGQPHIRNTRITVSDVAIMHLQLGKSIPEIAGEYAVDLASVYAALAHYFTHQQEIDARIAEDQAFAKRLQRQTPSKLQAKLAQLQYA